jgi:hypothetical protein
MMPHPGIPTLATAVPEKFEGFLIFDFKAELQGLEMVTTQV